MAHCDAGWWGHPRHQQSREETKNRGALYMTGIFSNFIANFEIHHPYGW
jgi:hypothetical protein